MKGTARRVVIVRSPDPKIFEEAIFVVREDYAREAGSGRGELLRDAEKAAEGYLGRSLGDGGRRAAGGGLSGWLCALTGAAATGLLWFALEVLRII